MPKRKTIDVVTVKALANTMLEKSIPELDRERVAYASFLERVLHETGNYRGFMFSDGEQGRLDESRRYYY